MRTFATGIILALPFLASPSPTNAADTPIGDSVVKIYSTLRFPDPVRPWNKQAPQEVSGTGVVVEGNRILTNAHVVHYASQVFVEGGGSGEKMAASVEAIGTGIDLALLKVDDPSFFEKRPPLPRSEGLPEVKDAVLVYGYPTGGTSLSITKGIVSRIEFAPYYDTTSGVRIQIDAAINPGNSGGPALVDDKVIGLAFSRLGGGDNIGYIIPCEEITLFLKDVADGKYDGKPMLFDFLQTLENDAVRSRLGLLKDPRGIIVSEPESMDPEYPLKPWDVIVKVGDHPVDTIGMVRVKEGLRLRFQYYIQSLAKDGKLPLTIVRDGKEMAVEVPVKTHRPSVFKELRGGYPSYFVYGPLTFSPVTSEFLSAFDRAAAQLYPALGAMGSPLVLRRGDKPRFDGEELVVVSSQMFPHKLSKGYSQPFAHVVKRVNGVEIKNLRHLVETLRDLKDEFVTFDFTERGAERIVFNRQDVLKSTDDILTDNGVRRQMSDDLSGVWQPKKD